MARLGAINPISGMGVIMFGPTLLEYGTRRAAAATSAIARGEDPLVPRPHSESWSRGRTSLSLQTKAEDKRATTG